MIRAFLFVFLILCSCASSLSLKKSIPDSQNTNVNTLQIIPLDIGQGDATLIITPAQKIILIDAGPIGSGVNVILPYLKEKNIDHIDMLFASQYDADHIAGFAEVMAGEDQVLGTEDDFIPDTTYDRGYEKFNGGIVFHNYLTAIDTTRTTINAGDVIDVEDGVEIKCLIVNGEMSDGNTINLADDDENGHSVGLLISYGNFKYWTSGDLTGGGLNTVDLESSVAPLVGSVDILHVNHHGSESSTNQNFVDALSPTLAIISTGDGNNYGHPDSTILSRLEKAGAQVYLTEKGNGGFLENEIVANGPIIIAVASNGNYTVDY